MRGSTLGRVAALCATLWVPIAIGCGDDDDGGGGTKDAGTSGSGGTGTSGSGGSGSTIVPLGDDVAGDACTSSDDCGGAQCDSQIPGATMFIQATAPGGYCTGDCMNDAQCGQGGACVGVPGLIGQCFARCMTAEDCRDEYICTMAQTVLGVSIPSTCRPKPVTVQLGDDVAGQACTTAEDCSGGMCATMRGIIGVASTPLPGGYCTGDCTEDSHCGGNGVCSPPLLMVQGLTGTCYQDCGSDSDCDREGYRCRDIGGGKRGCDPFPDPLPDGNAGKMCSTDGDCGGVMGTCRTVLPRGGGFDNTTSPAPEGYCSQACGEDADCGSGGVCVGFINAICFKSCATGTDCRTGYVCEMRGGGTFPGQPMMPADMVCAPADPEPPPDAGTDAGTIADAGTDAAGP